MDPTGGFTRILYNIAISRTIPRITKHYKRIYKPWFNNDYKDALLLRNRVLIRYIRNPSRDKLILFRVSIDTKLL